MNDLAKIAIKCELSKNANLFVTIPIVKGISVAKGSHFFSSFSCHKPASEHINEAVALVPYRFNFPDLFALRSLLRLLYHAAGVYVGHGGLYVPVSHLPLHHGELLSLFDSPCSVCMAVIVWMEVERHFLTLVVSLRGQFLHPFLHGPCGYLRARALYLREEQECLAIGCLSMESPDVLPEFPCQDGCEVQGAHISAFSRHGDGDLSS